MTIFWLAGIAGVGLIFHSYRLGGTTQRVHRNVIDLRSADLLSTYRLAIVQRSTVEDDPSG